MVTIMLAVVGCYVLAAFIVQIAYRLSRSREEANKHVILVSENDGHRMEWYLRSFFSFVRRTGLKARVTVVDHGSTDDTLPIAGRLAAANGSSAVTVSKMAELTNGAAESGKRLPVDEASANHLIWVLRSEGIVKTNEQPVVVDLQNPADLFKIPF